MQKNKDSDTNRPCPSELSEVATVKRLLLENEGGDRIGLCVGGGGVPWPWGTSKGLDAPVLPADAAADPPGCRAQTVNDRFPDLHTFSHANSKSVHTYRK